MAEIRKEIDTLAEEEEKDNLKRDCDALARIKQQAIHNYEELRKEFIINNHIMREDQVLVNKIFQFLKERA
jgi:flagellar biosynthesis/type III secretory pathway chaperone